MLIVLLLLLSPLYSVKKADKNVYIKIKSCAKLRCMNQNNFARAGVCARARAHTFAYV
jgi:hypothetical protein